MFLATDIFKNNNSLCVVDVVLDVIAAAAAAAVDLQKKNSACGRAAELGWRKLLPCFTTP